MSDDEGLPYYAGRRASEDRPSSRVRVYRRPDVPDRIFITCAWETTESGRPVERKLSPDTDEEKARLIADLTANKREMKIKEGEIEELEREEVTLERLLDAYHDSETAEKWSEHHRKNKQTCKNFWLNTLGREFVVNRDQLTPALVEKKAGDAARRNGWSNRTEERYIGYMRAACRWAFNKARLLSENPMRGVETPEVNPDTRELVYSLEEVQKLTTPHEDVNWRVTLGSNIAYDTGRRRKALSQLGSDNVALLELEGPTGEGETRLCLDFQGEHDKEDRAAWVPVSEQTAALVAEALERPEVQEGGHLFPSLSDPSKAMHPDVLSALLRDAEEALEIEHVHMRGWHGFKRRHVTESWDLSGGDAALVGDVTGNVDAELLRQVYRQQDRSTVTRHVDRVRGQLEAISEEGEGDGSEARETAEDTREDTRRGDDDADH